MAVYNVSYDLNCAGKNYDGLIKALREFPGYWHYLKSTWLIQTEDSPNQIWNRLSSYLDKDDLMLIMAVSANYQGWLPKAAWDWIHQHI